MPSREAVGAAPLVTGIVLASLAGRVIVRSGPTVWSVLSVVGGCAAAVVGLGTLRGREAFDAEGTASQSTRTTLVGLAALAFVAGAGLAVL